MIRRLFCELFHRKYWFHGLALTRCRKCDRIWLSRVTIVPGGKKPSLLRRPPPALRRVQ